MSSPSDWHSARLSGRFGLLADLAGAAGGGDGGGVEPPQATATITEQHRNGVVIRFTARQGITCDPRQSCIRRLDPHFGK
jgi:hypothetical protein